MYVIIVGCGRVGSELAKLLSLEGRDVVVIDKKDDAFSRLGESFNGITVRGNGVSPRILQEAGIEKADIFCAFTNSDNINIMASQVAKGIFKISRVIARVYDPRKAAIYKTFGLDILSEPTFFASLIRDKITDPGLSGYIIETNELGVLEIPVNEGWIGKTVSEVNVSGELVVTAIRKPEGPPIIPETTTVLERDDILLGVVKTASLNKIKKLLKI